MLLSFHGRQDRPGWGIRLESKLNEKSGSFRRRSLVWSSLIVGAAFLLVAAGLTIHSGVLLIRGVHVTGTVVKLIPSTDSKGNVMYTPVFNYTARNGATYMAVTNFSSNPPDYAIGQSISVLYEPGHPESATPESFGALWFLPVFFGGFGICLIAAGWAFRAFLRVRSAV